MTSTLFRPSLELSQPLQPWMWRVIRWTIVAATLGLIALSIIMPSVGLTIFWGVFVAFFPLLMLVAPGLWRNVCPLASFNQIPRTLGFTRGLTLPARVQQVTPLISAALLLLIVPMRKVLLDTNGIALAVFIMLLLALAFVGGSLFKGKSGWCTQFCPMLQIERFYAQSPLEVVPNAHCHPCVGCSTNCYDFNPTAALLADLHSESPRLGMNRKLFAGAMPWLIVAFFTQPYLSEITAPDVLETYGRILFFVAAGIGVYFVLEALLPVTNQRLILYHVTAAFNLFYAFVIPLTLTRFGLTPAFEQMTISGVPLSSSVGLLQLAALPGYFLQGGVLLLSMLWLRNALPRERQFLDAGVSAPPKAAEGILRAAREATSTKVAVQFDDGPVILADTGDSLLAVAEANHIGIDSGCRLGMCGADPVTVINGTENLSPPLAAEQQTLARLGLNATCRLACCARINGPVVIGVSADPATLLLSGLVSAGASTEEELHPDARRVVVVGSGVAGMTAALEARQQVPGAEVTLIGQEPYPPYNRLAIGKLVNETVSIDKLYLMPRDWAETKRIRFLRGVSATSIDSKEHVVLTDSEQEVPYDYLILATGARSAVPSVAGFETPGTFVLRTIDDAIELQQYIRRQRVRRAVIVGGGLLGLEAAYVISQMDVRTYVLERSEWPLSRQLDMHAGRLLERLMGELGIEIVTRAEIQTINGTENTTGVELKDGRALPADLVLVAVGIEPNSELARTAGLTVNRGIVVDQHMQTSDPAIFAAGDVTELDGRIYGLWPASLEQGRVAAINALGGDVSYGGIVPPAKLKVAAFDLLSVGEISAKEGQQEIVIEDQSAGSYRKLIIRDGLICGAILIGYAELADKVCAAVDSRQDVRSAIPQLEKGDWSILASPVS